MSQEALRSISFKLPEEVKHKLRRIAKSQRRSMTGTVIAMIESQPEPKRKDKEAA